MNTAFDVFLSHSSLDAEVISGVKGILDGHGLSVYVDWIVDDELDRMNVTIQTAEKLRERMRHSSSLIFATSDSSPDSKWMPWELGYFDGFRPGHVAVLPLVPTASSHFAGQEYVGLYPDIEVVALPSRREGLGIRITTGSKSGSTVSVARLPIDQITTKTEVRES